MEREVSSKPYLTADKFLESRANVYYYGVLTFGFFQAELYDQKIEKAIETLSSRYLAYPECRHLPTKSRMYRNIILDSHLIIFRVTEQRIEVLDIVYSASSIGKIRNTRKIRI